MKPLLNPPFVRVVGKPQEFNLLIVWTPEVKRAYRGLIIETRVAAAIFKDCVKLDSIYLIGLRALNLRDEVLLVKSGGGYFEVWARWRFKDSPE